MLSPLLYGLGAALAWGFGDYSGAMASRRSGAAWASVGMQLSGALTVIVALTALQAWPSWDASAVTWGIGLAALNATSLLLMYRALAIGPLAVVGPVVSANTAVTVLLIVLFLGERLSGAQTVAIAVTFTGMLLSSTDPRSLRLVLGRELRGAQLGLVAMVGFGAWGALTAGAAREHDPLLLLIMGRLAGSAFVLGAALASRARVPAAGRVPALGLMVAAGVLDAAANTVFIVGVSLGHAAIVATASGVYPVILVIFGIWLHGERLARTQYLGIAMLVGGLVALGASRLG